MCESTASVKFSRSRLDEADDKSNTVYMHASLSNLTSILLIIHAMMGCCHRHWHYSDECVAESHSICAVANLCCEACCRSHTPGDQPSEPCNGARECQGICSYLPTQRTVIDAPTCDESCDFVAVNPTILNGPMANAAFDWERANTANESPPPLRLHLLHQIILI